jgi:hypothetical protein
MGVLLGHDEDPDAGSIGNRFDHIRRWHHVLFRHFRPRQCHSGRDRNAGRGHHAFGDVLLHRKRRAQHAGMAVGNAEDFEQALEATIFAERTVQQVERDVRLQPCQHLGDVAADVEARDAIAAALGRIGAIIARAQRDLALR